MPSPTRCLTAGDAFDFVRALAVHEPTGSPRVGLELEWLTFSTIDRSRRVDLDDLAPALKTLGEALPGGSRLTVEPGGQLEISTQPSEQIDEVIDAARADAEITRDVLREYDIELVASGLDRCRPPARVVDAPRYRAMEAYFDHLGPDGRTMMCNSASIQINVDVDGRPCDAWKAAHVVAHDLGAQFNEPCPNRLDVWSRIDGTRTTPVGGLDPGPSWAQYALDARVMFIRTSDDHCEPVLDGMTFAAWIAHGHPLGWPTEDDLTEHLTTLFPPVRPRGWLELRTIDSLDDARWPAAAACAVTHLLDTPERRDLLEHACR